MIAKKEITAVILAQAGASNRFPVGDETVLRRLMESLVRQDIDSFFLCFHNGGAAAGESFEFTKDVRVKIIQEKMARGSAGSLLDAANSSRDDLFLVMHGNMVNVPDVKDLITAHHAVSADMTIVLGSQNTVAGLGRDANQLYICSRSVLERIPAVGYCDIKETLVPKLIASGRKVHAINCDEGFGGSRPSPEHRDAACENVHAVEQTVLAADPRVRSRINGLRCPNWLASAFKQAACGTRRVVDCFSRSLPIASNGDDSGWVLKLAGFMAVLICLLASYWNPTLKDLWRMWMRSDEFSSGLLVPFLAVYILWARRKELFECRVQPALFWGLCAFGVAQFARFLGMWLMLSSAENLSLVITVCAIVLLLFGWRFIWRIWPVLLFLFLMLPLPNRVQGWVTQPLQSWATTSAVFGLETIGYEVVQQGNTIILNDTSVGVAEACSGLRMLTAFIVISALIVLLVERRWWQKMIILASSIPVAFLCNTFRLIVTAIAFTYLDSQQWEKAFHDFGGLVMMPLALGIIVAELWLLKKIFLQPDSNKRTVVVRKRAVALND
ncbi:MAG: exosortase [Planctomycetes bacterium]|nr:exosortase [Planctomycetota bacterium]